jgi:hypothetical protein
MAGTDPPYCRRSEHLQRVAVGEFRYRVRANVTHEPCRKRNEGVPCPPRPSAARNSGQDSAAASSARGPPTAMRVPAKRPSRPRCSRSPRTRRRCAHGWHALFAAPGPRGSPAATRSIVNSDAPLAPPGTRYTKGMAAARTHGMPSASSASSAAFFDRLEGSGRLPCPHRSPDLHDLDAAPRRPSNERNPDHGRGCRPRELCGPPFREMNADCVHAGTSTFLQLVKATSSGESCRVKSNSERPPRPHCDARRLERGGRMAPDG